MSEKRPALTRVRARPSKFASRGTRWGNGVGQGAGHGGPAGGWGQGDGWGGPARGPGVPTAPVMIPGQPADKRARSAAKKRRSEALQAELEDLLFNLAVGAEREETRLSAAARLHAIYCGPPVARVMTAAVDDLSGLTDDELEAELARLSKLPGGSPQ